MQDHHSMYFMMFCGLLCTSWNAFAIARAALSASSQLWACKTLHLASSGVSPFPQNGPSLAPVWRECNESRVQP